MYFDRVVATSLCASGLGLTLTGRKAAGISLATLGGVLLTLSWAHQRDRYAGSVVEQLARAAARIRETTDAQLVVFGHAHRETQTDHYANTASFAFPREAPGHPLIEIQSSPCGHPDRLAAKRRYWMADNCFG